MQKSLMSLFASSGTMCKASSCVTINAPKIYRYDRVPSSEETVHPQLSTDTILRMSKQKVTTIDKKIARENHEKVLTKLLSDGKMRE